MLSSLPDHNFANTLSILIFRPALKSYDPNSLISGVYYCRIPRHRGEKRHFVERKFTKMGMQHPTRGLILTLREVFVLTLIHYYDGKQPQHKDQVLTSSVLSLRIHVTSHRNLVGTSLVLFTKHYKTCYIPHRYTHPIFIVIRIHNPYLI